MTAVLGSLVATGATRKVEALVGLAVVLALVYGFLSVPWIMIAVIVPLFVVLPALKVLVNSQLGPIKDVVSFSALCAAAILGVERRSARLPRRVDRTMLLLISAIFLLYVVNLGGLLTGESGHGIAWLQGLRLFGEPLVLLVVGLNLREPERNLRAAERAIVASAVACALFGLLQQVVGIGGLERYGYQYGVQIRQIGSQLRSFGSLDDPFLYASFLLLGLAVLVLSPRLTRWTVLFVAIVSLGLAVSFVRTAAVVALCIVGLALARRGHELVALLLVLVAVAGAGTFFVLASDQPSTRTVAVNPTTYLTLNGRTSLWRTEIGSVGNWPFGRGVGVIGTAAVRAQENLSGKSQVGTGPRVTAVDSGYLTLIGDVGVFGFAAYMGLGARIVVIGRRAVRRGFSGGWLAIASVLVVSVDAISRESFTGYPTAYVAMLLAGLACAASEAHARKLGQPA